MLIKGKKIAIVGGGPGGLTLARLLQLQGANVKVYERDFSAAARVQGTTLDLHDGSGLKALHQAELMDEFKNNYRPGADQKIIVNEQAEIFFSDHEKQEENFGSEHFRPEIDRGPLRKMLLESLHPETVVWDSQFSAMQKYNDGWLLQFRNETSVFADIVIGADGANSILRDYITPIKPFYVGITGLEGTVNNPEERVPNLIKLSKGGKILALGKGKTFTSNLKGDGSLGFYLTLKINEDWARNGEFNFSDKNQVLAWFKYEFLEWAPIWNEFLNNAETPFIPRPIYCMPLNQTWETQHNLTLIGDAAHLMPPFSGEGVNMAMLDAVELCNCLCNKKFINLQDAIAEYENKMLKRATDSAKVALTNGDLMHSENGLENIISLFKGI